METEQSHLLLCVDVIHHFECISSVNILFLLGFLLFFHFMNFLFFSVCLCVRVCATCNSVEIKLQISIIFVFSFYCCSLRMNTNVHWGGNSEHNFRRFDRKLHDSYEHLSLNVTQVSVPCAEFHAQFYSVSFSALFVCLFARVFFSLSTNRRMRSRKTRTTNNQQRNMFVWRML